MLSKALSSKPWLQKHSKWLRKNPDGAEVAITKSTGLSVSTRMCEVENVEFNSDGALGITVFKGQRKGSASTSDLSEKAIQQTVLAALDIANFTSEDPYAGPAKRADGQRNTRS